MSELLCFPHPWLWILLLLEWALLVPALGPFLLFPFLLLIKTMLNSA